MGARQSKRSVDITTTPKKEALPAEGDVAIGDVAAAPDGKLERIEEADAKPTVNGVAPRTEAAENNDKDETTEKDNDKEKDKQEVKAEDEKKESSGESPAENAEVTTPTVASPASPNAPAAEAAPSPDTKESKNSKEAKKKDKMKKKWSFRSISFRKDKSKPVREETPKNGDVTKEEPVTENGEEAESAAVTSPVDEKSSASSPSEVAATTTATKTEVAEEKKAATEEKEEKKCSSAAPLAGGVTTTATAEVADVVAPPVAVPNVEEKKQQQEVEVERSVEKKAVEVSGVAEPLEVRRVQPIATPSIIERKTSEDHPPLLPSSPPPTPIDPSPLQQARQAAASATALAEALKLPAETAREKENQTLASSYLLEDQTSPVTPNITPIPTSNVPPSADEPSNNTLNSSDPEPKLEDNNIVKEEISIEPVDDSEQLPADLQLDNVKEVVIEPTDVPSEVVENIEIVADPAEAFPNPEQATPLLISDDLVTAKPTLVIPNDQSLVAAETIVIVEKLDKGEKEIIEIAEVEDSSLKEADEDSLDLPPAPPVPEDQLSRNCTYYDNSENDVSIKSDGELPPAPFEGNSLDFNEYPLPPEELCSINSDAELPPNPAKPMNSTEVLLTPPQSLSPQSSQSFTSASMAKERSQGQFYESLADDQSNQEFKTESISLSLNSYADSEIELKERLADQEKTQLSNGTGHQDEPKSVLEAEATVEEVTKNIVTTESLEEAPKVAPPAIPSEPEKPTAPAITEDVTSVTKILEGNDISDKAIAAAVNDAIECNTNEMIVADANHQNNLNE